MTIYIWPGHDTISLGQSGTTRRSTIRAKQFLLIFLGLFLVGPLGLGIWRLSLEPEQGLVRKDSSVPAEAPTPSLPLEQEPGIARRLAGVPAVACHHWGQPVRWGTLTQEGLGETSDLAVSALTFGRLYHINEADSGTRFFLTNFKGREQKSIFIKGTSARSLEDMAVGPCPFASSCLFLGDIGDPQKRRQWVSIIVVKEEDHFPPSIVPQVVLKAKFPGGISYHSEALAIHPLTGDIFLLTGEKTASLFRLRRAVWENRGLESSVLEWERLGGVSLKGKAISLDIASHGKSFGVMTSRGIFEFPMNLSSGVSAVHESADLGKGLSYVEGHPKNPLGFLYSGKSEREPGQLMFLPCEKY